MLEVSSLRMFVLLLSSSFEDVTASLRSVMRIGLRKTGTQEIGKPENELCRDIRGRLFIAIFKRYCAKQDIRNVRGGLHRAASL